MPSITTTAMLIRYTNYRDNDKMVTLFSPNLGRIDAISRGCKRPKSPLLNACELFATGEFVFYHNRGRYTMTNASIYESFYELRLDYDRFVVASYILNLVEVAIQPEEPFEDLFRLLIKTMHPLAKEESDSKTLLALFLFHYANVMGFKPRLKHCISCAKPIATTKGLCFDIISGGVLCKGCFGNKSCSILTDEDYAWLLKALRTGPQDGDKMPEGAPLNLLRRFVEYRLDMPLRIKELPF